MQLWVFHLLYSPIHKHSLRLRTFHRSNRRQSIQRYRIKLKNVYNPQSCFHKMKSSFTSYDSELINLPSTLVMQLKQRYKNQLNTIKTNGKIKRRTKETRAVIHKSVSNLRKRNSKLSIDAIESCLLYFSCFLPFPGV